MSVGLYGAAVLETEKKDGYLVIGGSTQPDFDANATKGIRLIPNTGFDGNLNEIMQMRVARTECFAIVAGNDDVILIIGGTEAPVIEVMDYDDYEIYEPREMDRLSNNTFAQLCSYTVDINLKPCAMG